MRLVGERLCRLTYGSLLLLAATVSAAQSVPRLSACDADEGIAVVMMSGEQQALLRGEAEASGEWRLTQVASDSAVFVSMREPGTTVRVYLESLGRASLRITDKPPPAPPAVTLDIQRIQAKSKPPEAP